MVCFVDKKIQTSFMNMDDIQKDCVIWAKEIAETYIPDLIIFIAKSGFLFAKPMADYYGCELLDIMVSRPSNTRADVIKKIIPKLPRIVLAKYLAFKVGRKKYDKNSIRYLNIPDKLKKCETKNYQKILVVDDSVDTGWSLKVVIDYLDSKGLEGKYKIASYCVLSRAFQRTKVDFYRYLDAIIITGTSRYSGEYSNFLNSYEKWKNK